MKVIRPVPITDAALVSSSIAENDYPAWASGTTYGLNDMVIRPGIHRRFQSLIAGNVNHTPETSPSQWVDAGPTNRWAMFDQSTGSNSTAADSITLQLAPGIIDTLTLIDVDALSATVTLSSGGTMLYSTTLATAAGGVVIDDWYKYFTEPIGVRTVLIFEGLPLYANCQVSVTINASNGGTASVGTLLVGRMLEIGTTEADPSIGINDFSKRTTSDFGVTSIVPRAWTKKATIKAQMPTSFVDGIQIELGRLRATPTLWIGENGFDSLTIFGTYSDFSIDIAASDRSPITISLNGLVDIAA